MISLLIISIPLIITVLIVFSTVKTGISPLPSSRKAINAMISLIPDVDSIVDCGSGWGSLLLAVKRKYPERTCVGIESSIIPLWYSQIKIMLFGIKQTTFQYGDIYKTDLKNYSTILLYLYPEGMSRFAYNLRERINPGTVIISNCFALPDWEPVAVIELNDMYRTKVYKYLIR